MKFPPPSPSLSRAMMAFVNSGADRFQMNVLAWAETYGVSPDAIRSAWDVAKTAHSQLPQNSFEDPTE